MGSAAFDPCLNLANGFSISTLLLTIFYFSFKSGVVPKQSNFMLNLIIQVSC